MHAFCSTVNCLANYIASNWFVNFAENATDARLSNKGRPPCDEDRDEDRDEDDGGTTRIGTRMIGDDDVAVLISLSRSSSRSSSILSSSRSSSWSSSVLRDRSGRTRPALSAFQAAN